MEDLEQTSDMVGEYWDQHGFKNELEWKKNYRSDCNTVNMLNHENESADIDKFFNNEKIPKCKRITLLKRMIDYLIDEK